jgi:hypothetical protein
MNKENKRMMVKMLSEVLLPMTTDTDTTLE